MDKKSSSILIRAAQFLIVLAGSLTLGSGLNAYTRLFQLAQSGTSISANQLAQFPESLRWHIAAFVAAIFIHWQLERIYRKLAA